MFVLVALDTGNYAYPYGVFPTPAGLLVLPAPPDYTKVRMEMESLFSLDQKLLSPEAPVDHSYIATTFC